jgi:putative addiction module antidote
MNTQIRITRIGNSAGVVLPKEVLAHLGAQVGETLSVVTTPTGIELRRPEPEFDDQLAVAREVMARRSMALKVLAEIIDEDRDDLANLTKR